MTAIQRAVVDKDTGNINVHGRSGLELVWQVRSKEGDLLDLSDRDLVLEVGGWLRVLTTPGEDAYSRRSTVTREQMAALPLDYALHYALHDESVSPPCTLWSARMIVYGFNTAPAGGAPVTPGPSSWSGATITVQQTEGPPTIVVTHLGATGYFDPTTMAALNSADVSLETRISAEEGARAAADTSLETRLSTEEATRNSVDTSLTSRVGAIESGYLPLSGGVLTGALRVVAGVALAVGLAVGADAGTGLYSPGSQQLGIAAGGQHVATFEPGIVTVAGVGRPDADATRDLGTASSRWRDVYLSRNLKIGGAAPAGVATAAPSIHALGQSWGLITGDNVTDATIKQTRIGLAHYTNAEEPLLIAVAASTVSASEIYIGGGHSSGNAATSVYVYTGASTTTTTGTARWLWNNSGHYITAADGVYNIGAPTTGRPNNIYALANILTGSYIGWHNAARLISTTDGVILLANSTVSDLNRVQFGGTSNAFPSLKRVGTVIQARLADDSGFSGLRASQFALTNGEYLQTGGAAGDSVALTTSGGLSALLAVEANNVLALRNGANAQAFRVYGTTDGTNSELVSLRYSGGNFQLMAGKTGTGSNRSLSLGTADTERWFISGASGHFIPNAAATYDLATTSSRVRSGYFGTSIEIGGSAPSGSSSLTSYGRTFGLLTGDVLTDATTKTARIGLTHYTNAEEPVGLITASSTATTNVMTLGGGSSVLNAMTEIRVATAANNTTTSGTTRWYWDTSGRYLPWADSTYDFGAPTAQIRDAYIGRYLKVAGALDIKEGAAPTAITDTVRLYAEDNGSGKTRLMALFPTGAAVQIAIEP
jgi:hypothetical protein